MLIKTITPDLYHEVFHLQNLVHRDYLCESLTVLTSKVYASPSTCFVAIDGGEVVGYILSLPYPTGEIPSLTESVEAVDEKYNLLLHDCVVNPERRKSGIAAKLITAVEEAARLRGFVVISLVAVHGMSSFWGRYGWKVSDVPVLEEYGEADYMVKEL